MKCARFNRLLASTALGFVLAIASHPGMAQQAADQQNVDAGVPIPDTSLPPPLTAKDVQPEGKQNAAVTAPAAPATKTEPQPAQNAAAPAPAQNAAAPAQSATARAAEPAKPADAKKPAAAPKKDAVKH